MQNTEHIPITACADQQADDEPCQWEKANSD